MSATRRATLGHVAGAAAVAAAPVVAAEPDPFPALEREFWRCYRLDDLPDPTDPNDPRVAERLAGWHETMARIVATPARTPFGLRTKARLLRMELTIGQSAYGEDLAQSLIDDLERLAAIG